MSSDSLFLLVIPGFLSIWLGVLFILIKWSGWDKIATKYPYRSTFQGKIFRFCSAYIGVVHFKNAVDVGVSQEGLYLKPFILFRWYYPAAFIPWSEVSHFEEKSRWLVKYYRLDVGIPKLRTVVLPSKVFSLNPEILARLQRN